MDSAIIALRLREKITQNDYAFNSAAATIYQSLVGAGFISARVVGRV
jgi:hypothetical protein